MILLSAIAAVALFIAVVHALGRKMYRRTDQALTALPLLIAATVAAAVASLVAFAIPLGNDVLVWAIAFAFVFGEVSDSLLSSFSDEPVHLSEDEVPAGATMRGREESP